MEYDDKPLYIECACTDASHLIVLRRFVYDDDDCDEDREIYVSHYLGDHRNIFQRVYRAIKYTFGFKNTDGDFGGTMLYAEVIEKIIDYLQYTLRIWSKGEDKNKVIARDILRSRYIDCGRCPYSGYIMRWERDIDEWEFDKDIYVSCHLDSNNSIIKRVWMATKYVFGYKSMFGDFGSLELNIEDIKYLINFLQNTLEDWQIMDANYNKG